MNSVEEICEKAAKVKSVAAAFSTETKNKILLKIAEDLVKNSDYIIKENEKDLEASKDKPSFFLDRLALNKERISDMSEGVKKLVELEDPIGTVVEKWTADSGISISKVRVPLGVIGIIYEARPNVTVDAVSLCIKTGNCVVLRGSRDAICSNKALVGVMKASISSLGLVVDFVQLVPDVTREGAEMLMQCHGLVDVLIPRGSAELIRSVVEKSSIPVIETGSGNCHAYVHKSADFAMAINIILNGKTQRPSVCNALESLLIDEEIASEFLPKLSAALTEKNVEIVGCNKSVALCKNISLASDSDFYKEFLALKISVKIVKDVDEAIAHINKYGTHHSEVIIGSDKLAIEKFLSEVDSACVYSNASTRFTDGFMFGFGAEMGISTQKMHARGPLGLRQLTSEKYKIYGEGQIR